MVVSISIVYPHLSYATEYERVLYHVSLIWEKIKIQSTFFTECGPISQHSNVEKLLS